MPRIALGDEQLPVVEQDVGEQDLLGARRRDEHAVGCEIGLVGEQRGNDAVKRHDDRMDRRFDAHPLQKKKEKPV
ncbi:MAG: hypothetical protein U1E60_09565 [Reyranellaceae bacterium]